MTRINLISGPRNISTALMYAFAQRPDTQVLDEPFYACYLDRSKADHPGKEEVLLSLPADQTEVLDVIFRTWDKPVLFIKNMAHHIEVLDKTFLERVKNVFLIRDPQQIIASYAQVIDAPTMRDIGIQYQYELFKQLQDNGGAPVLIDSGILMEDPPALLKKVCEATGIDYSPAMLQWEAGPKWYDGVWAKYWYANVHQTRGFEKQRTGTRPLPKHLLGLYDEANDYYQKLLPFSLKP